MQSTTCTEIYRKPSSPRGFTLIELLTVIAIIGILAAIIIPTVGKVRRTAKESQATSNIRQTAIGLITSANEYKGRIPGQMDAINEFGAGQNPDTGEKYSWADLLQKNMGGSIKARSPMLLNPVVTATSSGDKVAGNPGSYDRKEALPDKTMTTEWGSNPFVLASGTDAMNSLQPEGGILTLANAVTSKVMILSSSPAHEAYKGVAENMFLLLYGGQRIQYTNRVNWLKPVPLTNAGIDDQAGGIAYDLGGRKSALFAFMDGHVARVAKGTVTFGNIYSKN